MSLHRRALIRTASLGPLIVSIAEAAGSYHRCGPRLLRAVLEWWYTPTWPYEIWYSADRALIGIRQHKIADQGVEVATSGDELAQGASGGAEGIEFRRAESIFVVGAAEFDEFPGQFVDH